MVSQTAFKWVNPIRPGLHIHTLGWTVSISRQFYKPAYGEHIFSKPLHTFSQAFHFTFELKNEIKNKIK